MYNFKNAILINCYEYFDKVRVPICTRYPLFHRLISEAGFPSVVLVLLIGLSNPENKVPGLRQTSQKLCTVPQPMAMSLWWSVSGIKIPLILSQLNTN